MLPSSRLAPGSSVARGRRSTTRRNGRPDGIRTRVARLRGGSPGSLEDRAILESGRRDRTRTCTGFKGPRVSETRVYAFHHPPTKWCGRRGSHPHGLSPTGSSGRRVCCSATSAKMDPARRVALRSSQYQWDASLPTLCRNKLGRGGRTCTSAARNGRRVYSALQLLLCHASENGGSGGTRTRIDTAYETVAQLLCYRAKWWAPDHSRPRRAC